MKSIALVFVSLAMLVVASSCNNVDKKAKGDAKKDSVSTLSSSFAEVELTADISHLSANEKEILKLMFEAAKLMDDIYWMEAFGNKDSLLNSITDEDQKQFAQINYGPWERLNDNKAFINGFGEKPSGANFYPADMSKEEFEALKDPNKTSLYTIIRRDEKGALKVIWYHDFFAEQINKASDLISKAALLAEDAGLKKYLELRAKALLSDDYQASDFAWMEMKTSNIDFVVGPIENYEDQLFSHKASHEAFILLKDNEWSKKLAYYTKFLPQMQKDLPVEANYKKEKPGLDVDLNAYDVLYYAGDCNAGSKTIAINLPNDEKVQLKKGSRKLQLKNAMRAKFDKILIPISDILIAPDQRKNVTFDAFFANTMFHEVAHGMGIKNTLDGKQTVRAALKDTYSAIEEGKADILGLYIITKLHEMGEMSEKELLDNYVTFMASTFRSIRFGGASAHGKANMIRFNYFEKAGAFTREADGTYRVNFEKMQLAMNALTKDILVMQGDGNYQAALNDITNNAVVKDQLKADLDRLNGAKIPKDIIFKQGAKVLGLE